MTPKLRSLFLAGSAAGLGALALAVAPTPAAAGPCAEQISEISRTMSENPSLGGQPTTGTLAGSGPGTITSVAPQPTQPAGAPSTSAGGRTDGEAGMKEMNTASSQVATSAQDVRLQQEGKPTVAQGGDPAAGDRMSQAKMQLEKARMLDSQGSQDCAGAVQEARRLMDGATVTR